MRRALDFDFKRGIYQCGNANKGLRYIWALPVGRGPYGENLLNLRNSLRHVGHKDGFFNDIVQCGPKFRQHCLNVLIR